MGKCLIVNRQIHLLTTKVMCRTPCLACVEPRASHVSNPVPHVSNPVPSCVEPRALMCRTPCLFVAWQGGNTFHRHGVAFDAIAVQESDSYEFI